MKEHKQTMVFIFPCLLFQINLSLGPVWAIVPIAHKVVDDTRGAILPCQAEGANVSVTAYRLKDDGTIFKKLTNPGVVLMRPKLDDTGTYMCVAKNRGGRIEYRFNLTVQGNPVFNTCCTKYIKYAEKYVRSSNSF